MLITSVPSTDYRLLIANFAMTANVNFLLHNFSTLLSLKWDLSYLTETLYARSRKHTETVSFRVDSDLRSTLEEEARKQRVNLNTLVSQILGQYANWGRYATRLKLLPLSKDLLRELFQPMSKEAIEVVGRRLGETLSREQILFLFQESSPRTVLRYMDLWGSHFDAYEHRYEGRRHFFTVHHGVNQGFSIFIREFVSAMFLTILAKGVQFEMISPNSVTFSFEA